MTTLDLAAYEHYLAVYRGEADRLSLAVVFEDARHPRDVNGRFKKAPEDWDGRLSSVIGDRANPDVPTDTQDLWTARNPRTKRWEYLPERAAFHKQIVKDALAGSPSRPEGEREALFTMGAPGSGKSTVVASGDLSPDRPVVVDVDMFRERLPEYQQLKSEGDRRADWIAQDEAGHIATLVLDAALRGGHHIVLDGLGTNPAFYDRLNRVLDDGWSAKAVIVTVPTETSIKRVDERFHATGRRVSYRLTRETSRKVAAQFPSFVKEYGPEVDIEVWDNSDKPRRIAHLGAEREVVADDYDALLAFLRKSREKDPAPPKPSPSAKPNAAPQPNPLSKARQIAARQGQLRMSAGLDLGWDPARHLRDARGRFREAVGGGEGIGRFLVAQDRADPEAGGSSGSEPYATAIKELRAGRKLSHWV